MKGSKWKVGEGSQGGSQIPFYFDESLVSGNAQVIIKLDEFDGYPLVLQEVAKSYATQPNKRDKASLTGDQLLLYQLFNGKLSLVSDWETPYQVYHDCKVDKNFKFIVRKTVAPTRVAKLGASLTEQMANRGQYSLTSKIDAISKRTPAASSVVPPVNNAAAAAAAAEKAAAEKAEAEAAAARLKEQEAAAAAALAAALQRQAEAEEAERLAEEERQRMLAEAQARREQEEREEIERRARRDAEEKQRLENEAAERAKLNEEERIKRELADKIEQEKRERERKEEEEAEARKKKEREEEERIENERIAAESAAAAAAAAIAVAAAVAKAEAEAAAAAAAAAAQAEQEENKKKSEEEAAAAATAAAAAAVTSSDASTATTPTSATKAEEEADKATARPATDGGSGGEEKKRMSRVKERRNSRAAKKEDELSIVGMDPMVLFVHLLSAARSSTFKEGMRRLKEQCHAEISSSYAQIHILGSDTRMKLVNEIKRYASFTPEVAAAHKRVIYRFCSAYINVLLKFCCDLPPETSPVNDSNREDICDIVEDDEEDNFLDIAPIAMKLWADENIKKIYYSMKAELFHDVSVDPVRHFFDAFPRLSSPNYVPTQEDIVILPTFTSEYSVWTQNVSYIKASGKNSKNKSVHLQRYIDCGAILPTMQYGLFRDFPVTVFVFWIDLMEFKEDAPIKAEGEPQEQVLRKTLGLFRTVYKYQKLKSKNLERPVIAFVCLDNVKLFMVKLTQNPDLLKKTFPSFDPSLCKNKADLGKFAIDFIKKRIQEEYIAGCNIAFHEVLFIQDVFKELASFASEVFQNDQLMEKLSAQFG